MFRFMAGVGVFSLPHSVLTGSSTHTASYIMVTGGSIPGDKAAAA
jgi:hypothetical protein